MQDYKCLACGCNERVPKCMLFCKEHWKRLGEFGRRAANRLSKELVFSVANKLDRDVLRNPEASIRTLVAMIREVSR